MASKLTLAANTWTEAAAAATTVTYYNVGQYPFYVNFTSTNTAPTDTVGLYVKPGDGVTKATLTSLTHVATPSYVWMRPVGGKTGQAVVESG